MVKGPSGILAVCPKAERPVYLSSDRQLRWPNGNVTLCFSAEEPERLRGPQHYKLWCDELAAWRYQEEAWDLAMLGLRLGSNPQVVVTTTPKPTKLIKLLQNDPTTYVTHGTTYENRPNLAPKFYSHIITKYENTRLGRQELLAEVLDDNPGALWTQSAIDRDRIKIVPELVRVVVGVDPAVSANEDSDLTGIVVAGRGREHPPHYYVLDDLSLLGSPNEWAEKVNLAYRTHKADRVVAEVNNGGDLVEANLRTKDIQFAYKAVHATRGKIIRAEPIAALYEQKRVHHVGMFAKLEDEMCDFNPQSSTKSPDRMDALVWALAELSEGADGFELFLATSSENAKRLAPPPNPQEIGGGLILGSAMVTVPAVVPGTVTVNEAVVVPGEAAREKVQPFTDPYSLLKRAARSK
jgi:phage terminase large subunit-like protein